MRLSFGFMRQQDPEDCDEFQLLPTKKGRSEGE